MKSLCLMFLAILAGTAAAQPGAHPAPATRAAQPAPVAPAVPPAPAPPTGPASATGAEILTLERAIEIAMRQQPARGNSASGKLTQ